MEIKFGPEIVSSYKRLSYTAWYALAEFIDNSTEAYLFNVEVMKPQLDAEDKKLQISIEYNEVASTITITDNSLGMSDKELEHALTIGKKPEKTNGRSRYGLGMKTAAFWLGNFWTIRTKKLYEENEYSIELDVEEIAKSNIDLKTTVVKKDIGLHYTVITISLLNRSLANRTKGDIKKYLSSMYRRDFSDYGLELLWQGEKLEWSYKKNIEDKLYKTRDGNLMRKDLNFSIGEGSTRKNITGWVGVFKSGSRKNAGFALVQVNRVIKGWPDSYKPNALFGESRNDLVNQRLVGELYLDEFAVSHTKDEILFLNNEEEELEAALLEECAEYKKFAQEFRKYSEDERVVSIGDGSAALNEFETELKSKELLDQIFSTDVESISTIRKSKANIIAAVTKRMEPSLKAVIRDLEVLIYLDDALSVNDPYITIESTQSEQRVIIIINLSHPHWNYLKNVDSVLNFIRHCTYDGIAEWKAQFKTATLDPDTIKYIKDGLLRIPLEIEKHSN